ncbi:hypothetical protein [Coxiella-like endosymbiont]|uniref:hypothetical protein n=1 Tax=Coxiella-like endosymbiont TaxID=1592897 RepID=UPI0027297AFE|nr:hypothetical protein [Coxiella-like endosymbiont]
MHRWFKNLFAILVITFYILISEFLALPIIILAGFYFFLPVKSRRQTLRRFPLSILLLWTGFSNWIFRLRPGHYWRIEGDADLDPKSWYILSGNSHCAKSEGNEVV